MAENDGYKKGLNTVQETEGAEGAKAPQNSEESLPEKAKETAQKVKKTVKVAKVATTATVILLKILPVIFIIIVLYLYGMLASGATIDTSSASNMLFQALGYSILCVIALFQTGSWSKQLMGI